MSLPSAIPTSYYVIFGIIEPLLTLGGFIGALLDPLKTYNEQATHPPHYTPPSTIPAPALVTITQLAHTCGLLGLINYSVLTAARKYLWKNPALQEKIARALFLPLLLGDVLHMAVTLYALGDARWDFAHYTATLWMIMIFGVGLLVPRVMWHLGVGRYVSKRDDRLGRNGSPQLLKL